MRLANKNIVITGGASGIGLAAAKACMEQGANVVIADLLRDDGDELAEQLARRFQQRCVYIATDVTDTEQVEQLFECANAEIGRIDSVFNNAGIGGVTPAVDYLDDDFLKIIDVNLNGVFRVARAAMRVMYRQSSGGNIINCASILGVFGQSNTAAYTAAKGGVVNMTRTLALEGAEHQVRVNAIGPGYIDTPLLDNLDEQTRQALIDLHPLKRLGRPEEIAAAVVFLASDEASFVTGAHLLVDGGFTAGKS